LIEQAKAFAAEVPCWESRTERMIEDTRTAVEGKREEIEALKQKHPKAFGSWIGRSEAIHELMRRCVAAGKHDQHIFIIGDPGTGKELVARAIHHLSDRKNKRFETCNCATIPPNLAENELFGHEKGAYSDAATQSEGLFQIANEGTLFLDELHHMSADVQAKLLRVIEYGEVRRVGSTQSEKVDVRVLCASNLQPNILRDKIRPDLLSRMVLKLAIHLPPLRDRGFDTMIAALEFADKEKIRFEVDGLALFGRLPGECNFRMVRENVLCLKQNILFDKEELLPIRAADVAKMMDESPETIPLPTPADAVAAWTLLSDKSDDAPKRRGRKKSLTPEVIQQRQDAIDKHGGNYCEAARELGISDSSLLQSNPRNKR